MSSGYPKDSGGVSELSVCVLVLVKYFLFIITEINRIKRMQTPPPRETMDDPVTH